MTTEKRRSLEKRAGDVHSMITTIAESPAFARYAGLGYPLGCGSHNNSPMQTAQLAFALALSKHPLVEQIIKDKPQCDKFDATPLVDAKVLFGLKILDMGCGLEPGFARCARILGAEVFTVDLADAAKFYFKTNIFGSEQRNIEIASHISVDLNSPEAIAIISAKSGVGFDFVTEAHLTSSGCYRGRTIAMQLLKSGGAYFEPPFTISIK